MDGLFVRSLLRDAIIMKPQLLGSNYREMVQQIMRMKVEGVCSRHGYVMSGSVALHKVSAGRIEGVSLNGDVRFDVQYYASVCNPPVGSILTARVVNTNKFGLLAHSGVTLPDGDFVPVIEVIMTKQPVAGISPTDDADATASIDLDAINAGDEVSVEILGKKFELNDDKISVFGRVVPTHKSKKVARHHHHTVALPPMTSAATAATSTITWMDDEDDVVNRHDDDILLESDDVVEKDVEDSEKSGSDDDGDDVVDNEAEDDLDASDAVDDIDIVEEVEEDDLDIDEDDDVEDEYDDVDEDIDVDDDLIDDPGNDSGDGEDGGFVKVK